MTTYHRLVKGATKIKMAPPKTKYTDPILLGTTNERDFGEIVNALEERINDSAWTVVFKSLAVAHLMIRDGDKDIALKYFSRNLDFFELRGLARSYPARSGDVQALDRYRLYLKVRSEEYGKVRKDYVRNSNTNLKKFDDNRSSECLEHVESLELQIGALIKNRYSQCDLNNDLIMFAFKMLVQDLLALYNALNEGIITLLESFFELTRSNAERTLKLYKRFVQLTENVVRYLKSAKAVGLKIPVIKHITTKLINLLEDHLREDTENKGNTFSKDDHTQVQSELERIRHQRITLENQLKHQSVQQIQQTQTGYNPFATSPMSMASPQFDTRPAQVANTSNPFQQYQQVQPQMTQQMPQQVPQQVQPQMTQQIPQQVPQQMQQQMPQQVAQQTGYNPFLQDLQMQQRAPQQTGHQQMPQQMQQQIQQQMPQQMAPPLQNTVTGIQPLQTGMMPLNNAATAPIIPSKTGPNNPFSLENVNRQQLQRQQTNPFSVQNYSQVSNNPFSTAPESSPLIVPPNRATTGNNTFGGLELLPTVPVFPQTQIQQGFQAVANQRSQNEPNLIDI